MTESKIKEIIKQGEENSVEFKESVYSENSNRPHGHGIINTTNFSPFPKNPVIAGVFKEIGFADELGSGVRNMNKYLQIYSKGTPQLIEEDVFKLIIPLTEQVAPQATPQDEKVQKIVEFCVVPKTREEVQEFLKLKDRKYFLSEVLKPLIESGVLKLTIPDNVTSPNQRYYSLEKIFDIKIDK